VKVTYFDIRSAAELSDYFDHPDAGSPEPISRVSEIFPDGADFLIAHHVLEHTADPIGELRGWIRMVRPGRALVISLPHHANCPDRERLLPDLEHLILDHVLRRGPDAFESREHVASFLCSWIEDAPGLAGLSAVDVFRQISRESRRSGHDFHWHAYDPALAHDVIVAAAGFEGARPRFHVDPRDQQGDPIDLLAVFDLIPGECEDTMASAMRALKLKLIQAADALPV
jgi:SAM-dependent methyltransferase